MITRRALLHVASAVALWAPCGAQEQAEPNGPLQRSVRWIENAQAANGCWGPVGESGKEIESAQAAPRDVAATALSIVSLLGYTSGSSLRGRNSAKMRRAWKWLNAAQTGGAQEVRTESLGQWLLAEVMAAFALCDAARDAHSDGEGRRRAIRTAFRAVMLRLRRDAKGTVDPERLAWALLCAESARRFQARVGETKEQLQSRNRDTALATWWSFVEELRVEVVRHRSSEPQEHPRQRAAVLLMDALALRLEAGPYRDVKAATGSLANPAAAVGPGGADCMSDPFARLYFALAARHHLRDSSEAFEATWTAFARKAKRQLESTLLREGAQAGTWDPVGASGLGADRVCVSAVNIILLDTIKECRPLAPRAWTRSLRTAISSATTLRISSAIDRRGYRRKTYVEVTDRKSVARVIENLRIDGKESGGHCMCHAYWFVDFYREKELLASLGIHHGARLRWASGPWAGDGELTEASSKFLVEWLAKHGIDGPKKEVEESAKRAAKRRGR